MRDFTQLRELLKAYRTQALQLAEDAELEDQHGQTIYDCPMCGGEGHVSYEGRADVITLAEDLGTCGIQVFGIGNGHQDIDTLLQMLLRLAPELLTERDQLEAERDQLKAEVEQLKGENKDLDRQLDSELEECERRHELLDQMAHKIAFHEGLHIGEHSNCNCPWHNAIDGVSEEPE